MNLINCKIDNFGIHQNLSIDFTEGNNQIIHENGWGKTTLVNFIKVMFYGFSGEDEVSIVANEREHYKPWNGGEYGGSITFQANGRKYRIERTFSANESGEEDTFDLYNVDTNLKSYDFTKKIGEELFGLNSDSFLKTVFVAQNSCGTGITNEISGKIGGFNSQLDEIDQFEHIQQNLNDEIEKLNADEGKGELTKIIAAIEELNESVRFKKGVQSEIDKINYDIGELIHTKQGEKDEITALEENKNALIFFKDIKNIKEKHEMLQANVLKEEERLGKQLEIFQNGVPKLEEIEDVYSKSTELVELNTLISENSFSDIEKGEYERLAVMFNNSLPSADDIIQLENSAKRITEINNLLTEKKLMSEEEAEYLALKDKFLIFHPEVDYIDGLVKDWHEHEAKKATLKTQTEKLTDLKERKDRQGSKEAKAKYVKNILLPGIASLAIGVLIFGMLRPIAILMLLIGVGLIIAAFVMPYFEKEVKVEDYSHEAKEYQNLLNDIRSDKEFINKVEREISGIFKKMEIPYRVDTVLGELKKVKADLKRYNEIIKIITNEDKDNLEKECQENVEILNGIFEKYNINIAEPEQIQSNIDKVRLDTDRYVRFANKKKLHTEMIKKQDEILNMQNGFFDKYQIEKIYNVPAQLQDLKEKVVVLNEDKEKYNIVLSEFKAFEIENEYDKIDKVTEPDQTRSVDELNSEIVEKVEKVKGIDEKISRLQIELERHCIELEKIEMTETKREALVQKKETIEKRLATFQETIKYLEEAKDKFKEKYMNPIKKGFDNYYSIIAQDGRRYEIDSNLEFKLIDSGSKREVAALSQGYQDLIGICRRIAMVDALYNEELPFLVFDDPFVNLDEEKLDGARKLIEGISKRYQVIYFTCHESRI